jgi:hypothetical protein
MAGGLLDFLMPRQSQDPWSGMRQSGPMGGGMGEGFLSQLLAPEVALPMAAQLLGNQGNAANFGNAFAAAGQGIGERKKLQAQTRERNQTLEYLRKNRPDLADMVANGMPVAEAWKSLTAQGPGLYNAGDGNLYDPKTKQWITAPNAGQKAPQVVELFDDATGQPYKATWNPETRSYERVGGVKARSGMQLTTNPDGTVTLTEGAIGGLPKLTESEGRSTGFYGRALESQKILDGLEKQGTSVYNQTMRNLPFGNYGLTASAQQYEQAKRDFVNAVLRRESGAVISEQEFANAEQQYFPQPGDSPEVIEQKRRNREITIQGLKVSAGQGANFAVPPQSGGNRTSSGIEWSIEP